MKETVILIIVIILSLLLASNTSAKSSDMFIDHLTDLIWKDCHGEDIQIHQPIIKYYAANQTLGLTKFPPSSEELNQTLFITRLHGQYSKEQLRQVIQLLTEQPYRTYDGQCDGIYSMVSNTGWEGCGILTCGKNKLNVNFDTYYWNGVKVDVPKEEFNIKTTQGNNSPIIDTGDNSPVTTGNNNLVTTGNNSPITQQDVDVSFEKGTILGTILGIVLTSLYRYINKRASKNKD